MFAVLQIPETPPAANCGWGSHTPVALMGDIGVYYRPNCGLVHGAHATPILTICARVDSCDGATSRHTCVSPGWETHTWVEGDSWGVCNGTPRGTTRLGSDAIHHSSAIPRPAKKTLTNCSPAIPYVAFCEQAWDCVLPSRMQHVSCPIDFQLFRYIRSHFIGFGIQLFSFYVLRKSVVLVMDLHYF